MAETRELSDQPLFFRGKRTVRADRPDSSPSQKAGQHEEKAVLCRACRAVITSLDRAVSMNNSHTHTFFNPAGIVYELRCFSKAPGCINHGRPTVEFTWFKGYTWEYALCATCFAHLGWFYNSPGGFFFGLIGSKLIVDESSG